MTTPDFFRARLDAMIDLRHPLAVLASRMPWAEIESALAPCFSRQDRQGRPIEGLDLFGPTLQVAGAGTSAAGRPRLPIRLMVGLLYLKHAFGESDESVVQRWAENPYWQFFCGGEYFETRLPCDPSGLTRFRRALGDAGVEELLAKTIETAVSLKAIAPQDLERVIIDSTVQEKAIAFPTDSRLLDVARRKLVLIAKRSGVVLRQTFEKEGRSLKRRAGGYAHAKQYRRMRKVLKRQRTILGRVMRDLERRLPMLTDGMKEMATLWLERARRIHTQRPKDKNKLYALHAPEVECIGKGKARQPYEFGVKVGIATTERGNLIVGARAFPGNPYDGHTLAEQIEQATILMQDVKGAPKPHTAIVDLGYRGVEVPGVEIIHRGRIRSLSAKARRLLKRRQAVEPVIGHLKDDCGLRRNWLKGSEGDVLHPVLCAAGYNLRWLMRAVVRLGLKALLVLCVLVGMLGWVVSGNAASPLGGRFGAGN
jgi:IS5 family transposase